MFMFGVMHGGGSNQSECARQSQSLNTTAISIPSAESATYDCDDKCDTVEHPSHMPLPKQYPPVGFKNWGNTCYANASLQCLMSTALSRALLEPKCFRIFKEYSSNFELLENGVGTVTSSEDPADDNECNNSSQNEYAPKSETCRWVTKELTKLCKDYSADPEDNFNFLIKFGISDNVIDPGNITRNVTRLSDCLTPGRQEDAHEFLRALISTLIMDGFNKQLSSLFDGLLESSVTCQSCGNCSQTRDRYMDLSLEISSPSIRSLHDALAHFTKTELLSEDNKVDCGKCQKRRQVSKGLRLATAPTILVCHLKRFMHDKYGRVNRVSKAITFPLTLDISDYMSKVNRSTPPLYELVGVLVHQGQTCSNGHYISYVRSGDEWYRASDNHVVLVSLDHVLTQKAYILMYEVKGMRNHKIPSNSSMSRKLESPRAFRPWKTGDSQLENYSNVDPCAIFSFLCTNSCFGVNNEKDHYNRSMQHRQGNFNNTGENMYTGQGAIPAGVSRNSSDSNDSQAGSIKASKSSSDPGGMHQRSNSSANLINDFPRVTQELLARQPLDVGPYDVRKPNRRARSLSRSRSNVSRTNAPVMIGNGNTSMSLPYKSDTSHGTSHRQRGALPPRPSRASSSSRTLY